MDLERFLIDFQDHLAPRLDTYEQAIYLYIFRHSRMLENSEVVIGFKSARRRMALGIGKAGTPIAEGRLREKLASLQSKGCLRILATERTGTRIQLMLPSEIAGVVPPVQAAISTDIEQVDFFSEPQGRAAILQREGGRCFYCRLVLSDQNYVIEHVVSRPTGNGSYRNVVAACRRCNDRKGAMDAGDFLRKLYREEFLNESELADCLQGIRRLQAGELRPDLTDTSS
jgi:hypothetical protein